MKSIFKLLIDIGPLAVFFVFYTRSDLKTAILPFMIATIIAVLFSYIIEKKIPIMPTAGAVIILIFGGLTIYFDNETFFKMKPTIINLLFAGGGDTISAIKMAKSEEGFSYISKAGGAFLEWLEGNESPGVKALKENKVS